MQTTQGHLLGGRVRYAQPAEGFRSGIEPVLLAAAIAARPGDRALEAGTGAGAALLCLASRVRPIEGVGVESNPELAALATRNAAENGLGGLCFLRGCMESVDLDGRFDHALANPPYHPHGGTASPDARRESAKRSEPGMLAHWATALGRPLRRRGTLTLILPASELPECLRAAEQADCPVSDILPLWPKPGRPAKLMLVRGVKLGRSPLRLLPGLVLHRPDGGFTPEAEAILREGAALEWH